MTASRSQSSGGDTLVFAEEADSPEPISNGPEKFKLLIVDDEKEIHVMTRLVLSDYSFNGRTLEFQSAFSAKEARGLLKDHPDAACVLLDVVMEKKNSGLEVVRYIREELKNEKIRIILRTGQPGKAPENDVILNYDINDYKEKTELTTQKLFTTVTTAFRSFSHLVDLEKKTVLIRDKNARLNEEVARRIVAESNLTKYNRSLEKMIADKSERLKKAISALQQKETDLQKATAQARVGDVSSAALSELKAPNETLQRNLDIINGYRSDMTALLGKYEVLRGIIATPADSVEDIVASAGEAVKGIDQFKNDVQIQKILDDYPRIIQDSSNGIAHISKAVCQIKRFIAIADESVEKTDVNQMVEQTIQDLKNAFSAAIELQLSLGEIPLLPVTPRNMEKAFFEVLKNSFEAIPTKGIIAISTTYARPHVVLDIRDMGHGIAPEHLDKVFQPYFTANRTDAQGLGLSFAKSVIDTHNGSISISSEQGQGTHLVIRLPAPDA